MTTEEWEEQRMLNRIKRIEKVIEDSKKKRQAKIERTDWLSKLNHEQYPFQYERVYDN